MQAAPLRALIALVLAALTLVSSGCQQLRPKATEPIAPVAASGRSGLQEVAAPGAVQQISARLSSRNPQVRIVAPSDDSLLPQGPWTLELELRDWPLAEAGDLGLGPHLVVQLDQQPPLRLDRRAASEPIAMPDLQPGSHRLTVYAARPWGEAVKSPGAVQQIRLHRVGRNAAELPARGSAQLIATSPDDLQQREPVLIDWLLLDAPLQHLRDEDTHWRLRISVNGDSFLVDRQTPIWLKGFRRGSNAVQLELLDGRGDALNPPFNSLVREVVISGAEGPAWQRASLNQEQLARLSGEQPAPPTAGQPARAADEPILNKENQDRTAAPAAATSVQAAGEPASDAAPSLRAPPAPERPATDPDAAQADGTSRSDPGAADPSPESARPVVPVAEERPPAIRAEASTVRDPSREASAASPPQPLQRQAAAAAGAPAPAAAQRPSLRRQQTGQELPRADQRAELKIDEADETAGGANPDANEKAEPDANEEAEPNANPEANQPAVAVLPSDPEPVGAGRAGAAGAATAARPERPLAPERPAAADTPAMPERITTSSSLAGSARAEVNADGSLTKPARRGPLAGLRKKLGA